MRVRWIILAAHYLAFLLNRKIQAAEWNRYRMMDCCYGKYESDDLECGRCGEWVTRTDKDEAGEVNQEVSSTDAVMRSDMIDRWLQRWTCWRWSESTHSIPFLVISCLAVSVEFGTLKMREQTTQIKHRSRKYEIDNIWKAWVKRDHGSTLSIENSFM